MELGDHIEQALTKVGITKQRVSHWLGRDCGCAARQEKLNELSRWAKSTLGDVYENAKSALEEVIGADKSVKVSEEWPEKIDVMWPLGTGSKWQDNELRYSIRSVVKYFEPLGRIYVVGTKPKWLSDEAVFIPAEDKRRVNKDVNIIQKVLLACAAGISQKYLFINDDQLLLRPAGVKDFPPLHCGEIRPGSNDWMKRLFRTKQALERHGLRVLHYEAHAPQIHDRDAFQEVFTKKVRYWKPPGVTINAAYFGVTQPDNPVHETGRHRRYPPKKDIVEWADGLYTLGYSDPQLTKEFKAWLTERFPDRTRYETDGN